MVEPVLTQDMHVYSTFSDGRNTIEENVAEAERIGLTELACVDHVRADTSWLPAYVAAVREGREQTPVVLQCAVEAKIERGFSVRRATAPDGLPHCTPVQRPSPARAKERQTSR